MSYEVKFRDQRRDLPRPEDLSGNKKDAVSPVLEGRMYEIVKFRDLSGQNWVVKTLKDKDVIQEYYPHMSLEDIFNSHLDEHSLFLKYLPEFTLPTEFYKEVDKTGKVYFCIVQPWIENGVQYKEAIKNNRHVPERQLGRLDQRVSFVKGLIGLINGSGGKLPDLDFFLTSNKGKVEIRVFDTGYFWYEKRGGKDRWYMARDLGNFLFSERERENKQVKELLEKLAG